VVHRTLVEKAEQLTKESPNDRPDGYLDRGATCPKEEETAPDCTALQ
jgi:hypothetical protein